MRKFIARRLLTAILTMLLVVTGVFALTRAFGDPRNVYVSDAFNASTDKEQWDAMGRQFGLDKPMYYQYGLFVGRLLRADLGNSFHQRRPVQDLIVERLPATAKLAFAAFLVAMLTSIPLGMLAAVRRGSVADLMARVFAILGHAVPGFWVAIVLIAFFGAYLQWLPTYGSGGIKHFILPSVTMGWAIAAAQLRLVRSSMLEVLDSEFVKFARAKGVSRQKVLWKHAFRNAMITPLTYAGLTLAGLITGSLLIEVVFAWPGLGLLSIQSVYNSDYATVQGVFLFIAAFKIGTTFLVDLLYGFVDPRIRFA